MLDWSTLSHANGSAEDIPVVLAELESTQSETILDELWQKIYYLGAVYSASFAALPDLIRIAERYHPRDRLKILSLIVGILTGEDADNLLRPHDSSLEIEPLQWMTTRDRIATAAPTRERYTTEIATLLRLTEESLDSQDWSESDFLYLLCAILALRGDVSWLDRLDYIRFGFDGTCANCDSAIDIFITEDPAFAECEGIDGEDRQTFLKPANSAEFTGSARWLDDTARQYRQDPVAGWIADWLGTGTCPLCKASFNVSEMYGNI